MVIGYYWGIFLTTILHKFGEDFLESIYFASMINNSRFFLPHLYAIERKTERG